MSGIATAIGAGVAAVGSVASAAISGSAASSAAKDQENAALSAQQIQENQYQQIQANEQPFMQAGTNATNLLQQYLGTAANNGSAGAGNYGSLLQPFTASDMAQYSPAYNFDRQQGMQGTLNGMSSSAGGESGATQSALIGFNNANALNAFSTADQLYMQQQGNTYNRLLGLSQTGQAAASQQAQSGTTLAGNAGNAAISAGNAAASGTIGTANAISNGINGVGGAATQAAYLQALGVGGAQSDSAYGLNDLSSINNNAFGQINSLIPGEDG